MDKYNPKENVARMLRSRRGPNDALVLEGRYSAKLIRDGAVVWQEIGKNQIPTEGMNYMLGVTLDDDTSKTITQWYMGISTAEVDSDSSTGSQLSGTGAVTEFTTYNADSNRVSIEFGTAASRAITHPAATFAINTGVSSTVVTGGFICGGGSAQTNSSTATILWSVFSFATAPTVIAGDQLDVTYSVTIGTTSLAGASDGAPT